MPLAPSPRRSPDDVTVVPWPTEDTLRVELAARRLPRLLMISAEADPPELLDDLEDWVRESAHPTDLLARSRALSQRSLGVGSAGPELDDGGLLRYGDRWSVIPDVQLGVVELLLERLDQVVPRAHLAAAYAARGGSTHPSSLRTLNARLGARVAEVGLALVTIRARGVVLSTSPHARP